MKQKMLLVSVLLIVALALSGFTPAVAVAAESTPTPACQPAALNSSSGETPVTSAYDPTAVRWVSITGVPVAFQAPVEREVVKEDIVKDVLTGVDWTNDSGMIVVAELYIPGLDPDVLQFIVMPGQRIVSLAAHSIAVWKYNGYSAPELVYQDLLVNSARALYTLDSQTGQLKLVVDLRVKK